MYADDTTLLCDFSNDHDIETLLNNELCKITDCLQANKLSLNVNKTKFMVFHSDRRCVVYPVLSINNTIMSMTMTMITDLLNINVAMNCYERAQALHAI